LPLAIACGFFCSTLAFTRPITTSAASSKNEGRPRHSNKASSTFRDTDRPAPEIRNLRNAEPQEAESVRCSTIRGTSVLRTTLEPIPRRLRSSGLRIERYPCRRMVAGVCLPARPSVYTTVHEPFRHLRREQKVIESHAFVLRPPFIFVIPECPERPVRI
jgi:hypothetical protein